MKNQFDSNGIKLSDYCEGDLHEADSDPVLIL